MVKFFSIVDNIIFEKIKNGQKAIKFYLDDNKCAGLTVNNKIMLLSELGEKDYDATYFNVPKWFLNSDIEKYSIMAVTMEIIHA